jgi:hypothetical protein
LLMNHRRLLWLCGGSFTKFRTWWTVFHPRYKWGHSIYTQGYNPSTKWDAPPSIRNQRPTGMSLKCSCNEWSRLWSASNHEWMSKWFRDANDMTWMQMQSMTMTWKDQCTNEWMSESINQSMNEWMNGWMNEWLNE